MNHQTTHGQYCWCHSCRPAVAPRPTFNIACKQRSPEMRRAVDAWAQVPAGRRSFS